MDEQLTQEQQMQAAYQENEKTIITYAFNLNQVNALIDALRRTETGTNVWPLLQNIIQQAQEQIQNLRLKEEQLKAKVMVDGADINEESEAIIGSKDFLQ